ncbi:MAG: hypothetical protein EBX52_00720 [Proteobacteria bacterium]|nr:hypothetical protein [Pseudomonadota bacterium]
MLTVIMNSVPVTSFEYSEDGTRLLGQIDFNSLNEFFNRGYENCKMNGGGNCVNYSDDYSLFGVIEMLSMTGKSGDSTLSLSARSDLNFRHLGDQGLIEFRAGPGTRVSLLTNRKAGSNTLSLELNSLNLFSPSFGTNAYLLTGSISVNDAGTKFAVQDLNAAGVFLQQDYKMLFNLNTEKQPSSASLVYDDVGGNYSLEFPADSNFRIMNQGLDNLPYGPYRLNIGAGSKMSLTSTRTLAGFSLLKAFGSLPFGLDKKKNFIQYNSGSGAFEVLGDARFSNFTAVVNRMILDLPAEFLDVHPAGTWDRLRIDGMNISAGTGPYSDELGIDFPVFMLGSLIWTQLMGDAEGDPSFTVFQKGPGKAAILPLLDKNASPGSNVGHLAFDSGSTNSVIHLEGNWYEVRSVSNRLLGLDLFSDGKDPNLGSIAVYLDPKTVIKLQDGLGVLSGGIRIDGWNGPGFESRVQGLCASGNCSVYSNGNQLSSGGSSDQMKK